MCDLLTAAEPKILNVALEGIENILKAAMVITKEHPNSNMLGMVTNLIEECSGAILHLPISLLILLGLQKLEDLQNHPAETVYEKSLRIMETYFFVEDSNGVVNNGLAVNAQGQQQYGFGAPVATNGQYSFANAAPAAGNQSYFFGPQGQGNPGSNVFNFNNMQG